MNVADEREAFLKAMAGKQSVREREVGGHSWRDNVAAHGPAILYAEIANITSRLKLMLWNNHGTIPDFDRLEDLLIDLGNYTEFLFIWTKEEQETAANPIGVARDGMIVMGQYESNVIS